MEIDGFDISRKLYANEFGLSVFEVLEKETGRTLILRLADFSNKSMDFKKAQWNQLQEEYRTVIADYSHLPRVLQLAKVDEDHLFTLWECDEGMTLLEKGSLGPEEVNQLVAAVKHLHENKIIHGAISAENIWMTTKGRVILYGAGEAKILEGKPRLGPVSDIRQLIKIIRNYSTISESKVDTLEVEDPATVEEFEMILTRPERKLGISDDNKLAGFLERKSMNQKAEAAERERKKAKQREQRGTSKLILGGIVLVVLILVGYFLF